MRLAFAVLLAASSAAAAVPEKGEGTITLLGGLRVIVPGNGDYLNEQGASHRILQPGGLVSLGYQYDEELHFKIEVGYMYDRYRIAGGDLQLKSIPILLALDTALVRGQAFTLYGGGGIGYSLNTGTRHGVSNEANSTAAYIALGLRFQLGGPLAIVLEDRYTLSSAQADAESQEKLTVGGNLLSLGLMFHFLEPDDKGKPTGR
jgi:outer membrane protein with beta-barrel domain